MNRFKILSTAGILIIGFSLFNVSRRLSAKIFTKGLTTYKDGIMRLLKIRTTVDVQSSNSTLIQKNSEIKHVDCNETKLKNDKLEEESSERELIRNSICNHRRLVSILDVSNKGLTSFKR